MNHLLAKTKGKDGQFFKVISDKEIYSYPDDLVHPKEYDAAYKLESDEWFVIKNFSEKEYFPEFLKAKFNSTEFDLIAQSNFNNIEYLTCYQTGLYYFQRVGSKQFIRKKLLSLNTLSITTDEPVIVINSTPDALFNSKDDKLYFKNLTTISPIFSGIELLYREATNDETEKFLQNDFIKCAEGYTTDSVNKANRKRIAMAMDTLSKFSDKDKKSIFKYIHGYCKDLKFDKKASNFTIESEEDLKQLIYGIEQRYYTTLLGNEKRLANSVIKINS